MSPDRYCTRFEPCLDQHNQLILSLLGEVRGLAWGWRARERGAGSGTGPTGRTCAVARVFTLSVIEGLHRFRLIWLPLNLITTPRSPSPAVRPRSSRSAIQSLMMDWRVTPSRRFPGRRFDHPGREVDVHPALFQCGTADPSEVQIACGLPSPLSNFWSNSSALIQRHLLLPGPARGGLPDPLLSGRSPPLTSAYHRSGRSPATVGSCPGRDLHPHDVLPDRLDGVEVDAVLLQVRCTLSRVKLEFHPVRLLPV